jgi:diaminopimelate epimerase
MLKFWKYQGAGNDFVMLDQRHEIAIARNDTARIARLCDRRFGIGADGLISLQNRAGYDFEMVYFNADGRESTMCGNGGRCIAAFAQHLGIVGATCHFTAIDGEHAANIAAKDEQTSWVELQMTNVQNVENEGDTFVLNTGSPHFVRFVQSVQGLDVVAKGRAVRYSDRWESAGINVNFVTETAGQALEIRTYERGVEDETLACGTGVTAAAIAASLRRGAQVGTFEISVKARGGDLKVRFRANGDGTFSDVWLCGPAAQVFEGRWR